MPDTDGNADRWGSRSFIPTYTVVRGQAPCAFDTLRKIYAKCHYETWHFDKLSAPGNRGSGACGALGHAGCVVTGLRAFLAKTPRCRAALLAYGGTETLKLADRLWAVPLAAVLD